MGGARLHACACADLYDVISHVPFAINKCKMAGIDDQVQLQAEDEDEFGDITEGK